MGKNVLVTGTSQGLGLSLCKEFKERGYTVYALDYCLSDDIKALEDDKLTAYCCDVSDFAAVTEVVEKIGAEKIDAVINNAGVWLDRARLPLLDENYNLDDVLTQFKINALGVLHIAKTTIPLLQGGVMVNISSEAGSIGECHRNCEYGYSMSKAAQNMATKILSNAFSEQGIKFYALHPGWMITPQGIAGASGEYYPDTEPSYTAKLVADLVENRDKEGIYYDIITNREMPW